MKIEPVVASNNMVLPGKLPGEDMNSSRYSVVRSSLLDEKSVGRSIQDLRSFVGLDNVSNELQVGRFQRMKS
jgi:hypothetical protein